MLLTQYLITALSLLITPFTVIGIALLVEFYHDTVSNSEA